MGNCVVLNTSKLISTEARGGLNQQPLCPADEDDEKCGRDGQKRKERSRSSSRSSESKEAEDLSFSKPAVSCRNPREGAVRVKVVIRKQELAELLSNGLAKKATMEDLLVELQVKLGDQSTALYNPCEGNCGSVVRMRSHSGWRPSLESVPEDTNTNN